MQRTMTENTPRKPRTPDGYRKPVDWKRTSNDQKAIKVAVIAIIVLLGFAAFILVGVLLRLGWEMVP
jgi:hypothetical protein